VFRKGVTVPKGCKFPPKLRVEAVRLHRMSAWRRLRAAAESFMATIKTELAHRQRFKTRDEATPAVLGYIEGPFNPRRRHSALGCRSPAAYEMMLRNNEALPASGCPTTGRCQRERGNSTQPRGGPYRVRVRRESNRRG